MRKLINSILSLKNGNIRNSVDRRIREFSAFGGPAAGWKSLGKKSDKEIFKELCFCLLTANFNAERAIKIQKEIGNGFLNLTEKRLAQTLRALGYRYPNIRAKYIVAARKTYVRCRTPHIIVYHERSRRDWLVKNIKGLGYKEASHFLRNIGYENFAIIDFHIVDLLVRYNLTYRPKYLTKTRYFEIENLLAKIAEKSKLTLAELDLYLWYMETGKVLK